MPEVRGDGARGTMLGEPSQRAECGALGLSVDLHTNKHFARDLGQFKLRRPREGCVAFS